ncbi:helix-turn-helix domain-containing protein [Marinomonas mediterranea]|jgi:AraC-type DNA-binding domain-containing proteins|uniref:Transcriptional regulator, AraC family n=1 Tax=Marinomonas mediterranea (strain ATCC 700492 / JCM 21426 / NBRC 103028 / MMB-1) TaxID=717774 RepID=F2JVF1_MARM1|nr:helix-turn-helix domain-containing protein [Marinomonas mediterranea]ADZ89409.1 transcriptional regulator, AraC family [Marinomonas mediterranea MMB-1]WCN07503.1 helix-turn-helix domain-containing protein [Marinomonas mediterranea]WCN15667.1 helix-turn-helix domain-containing protein [Marinomonas mediterranea MMB-1]
MNAEPNDQTDVQRLVTASWAVGRSCEPIRIERLECEEGFSVVKSYSKSNDVLTEYSDHDGSERHLIVTFGLSGASDFTDINGKGLLFSERYTTMSIFRSGRGERRYSAGAKVEQLRLVVSESTLQNFVGEERCQAIMGRPLQKSESFRALAYEQSRISPHLQFFRTTQLGDQCCGLNQRLHALNLLSEQLSHYVPLKKRHERISDRDLECITRVEAYMRAHMDKPISNAYLCNVLGISEYKLKSCFRQLYNTSPAQHLFEIRMQKAWELLESGYQVAETAYRVGYRHPSNFSSAFTTFFNCTPKSVRYCLI